MVDRKRYPTWEKYLFQLYHKNISIDKILIQGVNNLEYKKIENNYEISINPNIICSEVPAKLIDICALINYGNLEISPYPIFDIVMDKLGEYIPILYAEYK